MYAAQRRFLSMRSMIACATWSDAHAWRSFFAADRSMWKYWTTSRSCSLGMPHGGTDQERRASPKIPIIRHHRTMVTKMKIQRLRLFLTGARNMESLSISKPSVYEVYLQ
jgi:hypothetical protein